MEGWNNTIKKKKTSRIPPQIKRPKNEEELKKEARENYLLKMEQIIVQKRHNNLPLSDEEKRLEPEIATMNRESDKLADEQMRRGFGRRF